VLFRSARAVVGRTDGTVLEVTLATGAARTLHRANAAVTHVATGANGQFAAAAADGTLLLGGSGAVRPVRLSGTPSALDLASDGVAVVGTRTGAVESWSVGSGQRLSSASPHAGPVTAVAAAPGRLAVSADGTGRLARHAGGQATTAPRPVPGAVNALALRNTPNRILATSADGTVHVLDGQSFREVARMIANSGGWAVVSPEGRYDGAVDSFSDIVWATPVENLPVDRFASRYYEPGLLAKSVQPGLSLSTRPSASISQEVRLPPEVDITVSPTSGVQAGQTLTITVTALNRSDGTDPQVRLFNNGKRVPAGAIITDSGGAADGGRQRTVTYGLPAVEGSNALSAVALGWQDAESAPATATVKARGGGGGTLYLTSVGINTYRGAGLLPLTFAAKDARSVSSLFRQSIRTPYAGVRDTVILDGQATRGAVEAHLKSLRAVSPTDVVVVYLAGHGRTVDNEWYFVTADVSAASAAAVRSQGISAARLADHLRQIPAQKVLLMVDSCGSGAALTQFEGFDQRRNLDALSRAVGVHVLTAARAGQEAPEYGVLGHGLFTYAFLQAFQGGSTRQADRAPRDGQVTVTEIKGYIEDAVPVVVRSLEKQLAQLAGTRGGIAGRTMVTPVGISRGADFVLAR